MTGVNKTDHPAYAAMRQAAAEIYEPDSEALSFYVDVADRETLSGMDSSIPFAWIVFDWGTRLVPFSKPYAADEVRNYIDGVVGAKHSLLLLE